MRGASVQGCTDHQDRGQRPPEGAVGRCPAGFAPNSGQRIDHKSITPRNRCFCGKMKDKFCSNGIFQLCGERTADCVKWTSGRPETPYASAGLDRPIRLDFCSCRRRYRRMLAVGLSRQFLPRRGCCSSDQTGITQLRLWRVIATKSLTPTLNPLISLPPQNLPTVDTYPARCRSPWVTSVRTASRNPGSSPAFSAAKITR